jgi:TolB-like protein/Tfp pilus assembly protein PilF
MDLAVGSRALDLLLLLLRRHGEILSRDEIMDAVWPGSSVEESNLTVQMAALRRILDQVGSAPSCIQTISGRGYRFLPTVTMEVAVAVTTDAAVVVHTAVPDPRRRPSIMVLPFKNLGDDANSDHLVGAITADLTTDLSRLGGAVVVAYATVGTDEAGLTDGRNMSAGSGACYRIEGSVRGTPDETRVNVQLIDVSTGVHLWAERFDVVPGGTTDVRDEITGRLLRTLSVKLIEDMNSRIEAVPPQDWTPYDLIVHGRAVASRPMSAVNRSEAMRCFEQALVKDPGSVGARFGIAAVLVSNILEGWSQSVEPDQVRAEQLLLGVLQDDPDFPEGHAYMGMLRRLQGRLSDSMIELEIAIALAPNSAFATGQLGVTLAFVGQPAAAIQQFEKSLRLAPNDRATPVHYSVLGLCQLLLGRTDEAISSLRKARSRNPMLYYTHLLLAAAFGLGGELDEAGAALRQVIELQPEMDSLSAVRARWHKRSSPDTGILWEKTVGVGLQRAGLPLTAPE